MSKLVEITLKYYTKWPWCLGILPPIAEFVQIATHFRVECACVSVGMGATKPASRLCPRLDGFWRRYRAVSFLLASNAFDLFARAVLALIKLHPLTILGHFLRPNSLSCETSSFWGAMKLVLLAVFLISHRVQTAQPSRSSDITDPKHHSRSQETEV